MNFHEIERRYQELTRDYQQQKFSLEDYRTKIRDLWLKDEFGRVWMIQELSGQWHVYLNGVWQPAQPPGAPHPAPRKTAPKSQTMKWIGLAGFAGFGAIALCLGVIALVYFLRNNNESKLAFQSSKAQEIAFSTLSTLSVPADGSLHTDEHGVGLLVPAGALEETEGKIQLTSYELPKEIHRELDSVFDLGTPIYQVAIDGEMDGIGNGELSFPFEGQEAVLMVIIDDQYFSFLPQEPEGGVVRVGAHLGPSISNEPSLEGSASSGSANNIRYALLSPKQSLGNAPDSNTLPISNRVARDGKAFSPYQASWRNYSKPQDPQDCSVMNYMEDLSQEDNIIFASHCRTNKEKSLIVNWSSISKKDITTGVQFTQQEAEHLIQEAEKLVKTFENAGFEQAKVQSQWFGYSLKIVVMASGEPQYNPRNSVIYLPVDTARGFSADSPPLELMHEMAHWIQHKKYSLLRAAKNNPRKWWIETSAEVMVFTVAPKGIDHNLSLYGKQTGFQKSPFQWDEILYIHAQPLRVAICDNASVCPLSEKSFKEAINTGVYPFLDSGNQEKLNNNLDDYALYLLDSPPKKSNTTATKNVKMGGNFQTGIGEMINIGSKKGSKFSFTIFSDDQIKEIKSNNLLAEMAVVDAIIEKGGVYPLTVASGETGGQRTALPAVMVIKPGPPFWLKIGDQEPVRYDGTTEYIIQPISDKLGQPIVRVVALGTGDTNRFQAEVSLIDLQGDWVLADSKLVSLSNSCTNDGVEFSADPIVVVESLSRHFASRGIYKAGIVNGELGFAYEANPGQSLTEDRTFYSKDKSQSARYGITQAANISLEPETIEWKMDLKMRAAEGQSSLPGWLAASYSSTPPPAFGLGLLILALPGGLWLSAAGKSPRRRLLGLGLVLALVSLACIKSLDMTTSARLNRIEYLIPIGKPPAKASIDTPTFRLTGAPVSTVIDVTLVIPEDNFLPGNSRHKKGDELTCKFEIITESVIKIYPDGIISGVDFFNTNLKDE